MTYKKGLLGQTGSGPVSLSPCHFTDFGKSVNFATAKSRLRKCIIFIAPSFNQLKLQITTDTFVIKNNWRSPRFMLAVLPFLHSIIEKSLSRPNVLVTVRLFSLFSRF